MVHACDLFPPLGVHRTDLLSQLIFIEVLHLLQLGDCLRFVFSAERLFPHSLVGLLFGLFADLLFGLLFGW